MILIAYEKINERIHNSARTLIEHGAEVETRLWLRGSINERQRTDEEDAALGARYIGGGSPGWLGMLSGFVKYCRTTYREVVEAPCDVIHVTHLILLPLGIALKWRVGCRVLYDAFEFHSHSIGERLSRLGVPGGIVYRFESLLVRRVDGVATIDSRDGFLEAFYKRYCPNVKIIYNVPNLAEEGDLARSDELTRKYDGRSVVLYVGGMTREKGLFRMLRAIRDVADVHPTVMLVCVGTIRDDSGARVARYLEENDLAGHVDFVPWLPFSGLAPYFRMAEVGLALYERTPRFELLGGGNGRKLFLYMQYGIPFIAPAWGQVARIALQEGACVTTATDDAEAVAGALKRLLTDSDLRRRMSQNGRSAFVERYNWEAEQEKLLDLYRSIGGTPLVFEIDPPRH